MGEHEDAKMSGMRAAEGGERRSGNPHPVSSEAWAIWMDAFDAATVRQDRDKHRPPYACVVGGA